MPSACSRAVTAWSSMASLECVAGVQQAGRIHERELRVPLGVDPDHRVARRLRFGTRDGEVHAHDAVEQCGFSGVGATGEHDGREAGVVRAWGHHPRRSKG